MTTMTEIAPAAGQKKLAQMVVDMKAELALALPKHVSPDRVARIALTAIRRDKNLANCTPESFIGALMTASQLGLEVNTPAGEAYLIPYGRECTFVLGYQGIIKLFWQHPQAKHIDAQTVYTNDAFSYTYGLNPTLAHVPTTGDRGDVKCYYAVATLTNGGSAFAVLTPDEVKLLRGGKVGPDARFKGGDPMRWMERKTTLKQMLKLLPRTVELTAALAVDEQVRTDYTSTLDAIEARPVGEITSAPVTADEITGHVDIPETPEEIAAEAATDQQPDTDGAGGDLITPAQLAKLHIQLGEAGLGDRDDGLAYLSGRLGRIITTSKEVSKDEATRLIDAFENDTWNDDNAEPPLDSL